MAWGSKTTGIMKIKRERKVLTAIILIILLVGFGYTYLISGREFWDDEHDFDITAQNVVQGNGFSRIPNSSVPMIRRVPLYPLFLAFIYALFGHSFAAARVFQIFLVALTALIGYLVARLIFKGELAFLSLLLIGLWPPLIVFSTRIMSEVLNTLLLSLSILCLVMLLHRRSIVLAFISGLLIGITTLCKATTALFPFFVFLFLILVYRSKKEALFHGLILILAAAVAISPWTIRNYVQFKTFIPLQLGVSPGFWVGTDISEGGRWQGEDKMLHHKFSKALRDDHLYVEKFYFKEAIENIKENPGGYLILLVKKAGGFWRRPSVGGVEKFGLKKILIRGSNYLLHYLAIVFGIIGSILVVKRKILLAYPLILIVFYYTLMHALLFAEPRYHIPVLPMLIILATYGFSRTLARLGPKYQRVFKCFSSE
jgi:4-amino-4-deoxy-L-arabinose transferase-like glycosyltransferase